jgi:hypothetical protein
MISVAKRVSAGMRRADVPYATKMEYGVLWLMMKRMRVCTDLRWTLNGFAQSSISRSARWPLQPSASSTIASSIRVSARTQPPPRSVTRTLTIDDFFLVMRTQASPVPTTLTTSVTGPAFSVAAM